ncbi:MAG: DNA polymerase III subunit epsilon [Rickettsiales bacterium]|nr:DNA polymerase III subunit epsilon [Rickettsiales bacterium]
MRELCLDIETTGLDPRNGDKIIEIACVELVNKIKTGNSFHSYINPRREVPEDAFKIHGISTKFLQDKPIFDHIAAKFLEFIKDDKLIIHNAAFDTKFINHELRILGFAELKMENVIDTLLIARKKFPGAPASLDALCKRFNIDLSKRGKHGALLDSELLCDVYIELLGGAQSGLVFASSKVETQKSAAANLSQISLPQIRRSIAKRDFPVSESDLQKHQEFIKKNFKTNFWGF